MESFIKDQIFDEERALYASRDLVVDHCKFDGPADGESAFKESRNVKVSNSFFNLRYPLWHVDGLKLENSKMTENCRAALWYTKNAVITDTGFYGIKALRECENVRIENSDVKSEEFGWFNRDIMMKDTSVQTEYFMMRSDRLQFDHVKLKGKYSFQYITDSEFDNCDFDTKDAFWHARNVVIKNSTIKGEYLAWYCENVVFDHCTIIGTQPLCYCKNLKLIDCRMIDTDLAFEKSEVSAAVTTPMISIKNPLRGTISVPKVDEIIRDDDLSQAKIIVSLQGKCA